MSEKNSQEGSEEGEIIDEGQEQDIQVGYLQKANEHKLLKDDSRDLKYQVKLQNSDSEKEGNQDNKIKFRDYLDKQSYDFRKEYVTDTGNISAINRSHNKSKEDVSDSEREKEREKPKASSKLKSHVSGYSNIPPLDSRDYPSRDKYMGRGMVKPHRGYGIRRHDSYMHYPPPMYDRAPPYRGGRGFHGYKEREFMKGGYYGGYKRDFRRDCRYDSFYQGGLNGGIEDNSKELSESQIQELLQQIEIKVNSVKVNGFSRDIPMKCQNIFEAIKALMKLKQAKSLVGKRDIENLCESVYNSLKAIHDHLSLTLTQRADFSWVRRAYQIAFENKDSLFDLKSMQRDVESWLQHKVFDIDDHKCNRIHERRRHERKSRRRSRRSTSRSKSKTISRTKSRSQSPLRKGTGVSSQDKDFSKSKASDQSRSGSDSFSKSIKSSTNDSLSKSSIQTLSSLPYNNNSNNDNTNLNSNSLNNNNTTKTQKNDLGKKRKVEGSRTQSEKRARVVRSSSRQKRNLSSSSSDSSSSSSVSSDFSHSSQSDSGRSVSEMVQQAKLQQQKQQQQSLHLQQQQQNYSKQSQQHPDSSDHFADLDDNVNYNLKSLGVKGNKQASPNKSQKSLNQMPQNSQLQVSQKQSQNRQQFGQITKSVSSKSNSQISDPQTPKTSKSQSLENQFNNIKKIDETSVKQVDFTDMYDFQNYDEQNQFDHDQNKQENNTDIRSNSVEIMAVQSVAFDLKDKQASQLSDIVQQLIRQRKCILVLDLDHTLLNSVKFHEVDSETVSRLEQRLEYEQGSLEQEDRELFYFPEIQMWTKLRPGVRLFLQDMSLYFQLAIHTNGHQLYADQMKMLLDPNNEYFGDRVVAQGVSQTDDVALYAKKLDQSLGVCEPLVIIMDDSPTVWQQYEHNLLEIEHYIYFPAAVKRFGRSGPSLFEINRDECRSSGMLLRAGQILISIHRELFQRIKSSKIPLDLDNSWHTKQSIDSCRKQILQNVCITFSHVIPLNEDPQNNYYWKIALKFGAQCLTQPAAQTTHLVAGNLGTQKVSWALSQGKFVVSTRWLECSAALWQKADESRFPVVRAAQPQ